MIRAIPRLDNHESISASVAVSDDRKIKANSPCFAQCDTTNPRLSATETALEPLTSDIRNQQRPKAWFYEDRTDVWAGLAIGDCPRGSLGHALVALTVNDPNFRNTVKIQSGRPSSLSCCASKGCGTGSE